MRQLFVYGTLRKGGISHHLLKGAKVLQEGVWLQGFSLYSAGWYPVAVPDKNGKIKGDIIAVADALWPALDTYEGSEYTRLYVEEAGVWLYVFNSDPAAMIKVTAGDWLS